MLFKSINHLVAYFMPRVCVKIGWFHHPSLNGFQGGFINDTNNRSVGSWLVAGGKRNERKQVNEWWRDHFEIIWILSAFYLQTNDDYDALIIVEFKTTLKLIEYSTVLLYISPASFTVRDIVWIEMKKVWDLQCMFNCNLIYVIAYISVVKFLWIVLSASLTNKSCY